jgi:hypothetical protein
MGAYLGTARRGNFRLSASSGILVFLAFSLAACSNPASWIQDTWTHLAQPASLAQSFALTLAVSGSGTTTPQAGTTRVVPAAPNSIVAVAAVGWHFAGWTATGGASVDSPSAVSANATLTAAGTVTAVFAIDQYTMIMAAMGLGTVTPAAGPTIVTYGQAYPITATPAAGYHFANWTTTGGASIDSPNNASAHATFSAPGTVTAHFLPYLVAADSLPPYNNYPSSGTGYIYTSIDGGVTWTKQPDSGPKTWGALAISSDGNTLTASTGHYVLANTGYIWRSMDGGATWTKFSATPGLSNWTCVASSANGQILAVGDYYGSQKIQVSTDGGSSWSPGGSFSGNWSSVSLSSDGSTLVAGAGGAGSPLYKSTNSGLTWVSCDSAYPSYQWSASRISMDGTKICAAEINTGGSSTGSIWTSTTAGGSLTKQTASAPAYYNQIALSSDGARAVAVEYGTGSGGYIHISTDGGVTWTQESAPGLARWNSVSCTADGMGIIACADDQQALWISLDGGSTWSSHTVDATGGHSWSSVVVQH